MGKKNWQKLAETDDLSEFNLSPHRGRGWKIFSGLLFMVTAAFVAGYYVPLYRAHALLRAEYKATSSEAATFRKQLEATVAAFDHTTGECSNLREELRRQTKDTEAILARAERIERMLQTPLKKYQGKGKVQMERQREKLRISLAAPALIAAKGATLTEFGKKALCAIGGSLKNSDVRVVVQGLWVESTDKANSAWLLAAARAATAAQQLTESCGVDASLVDVAVSASANAIDGNAVALEIAPRT
jgi:flagellar motor protein MotB